MDRRLRVLMLCAHEPTMDPRVKWTAEFAAKNFDVTVLGFNREDNSNPADEERDGYRIVRLKREDLDPRIYVEHLKQILHPPMRQAADLLLPLSGPAMVVGQAAMRVHGAAANRIPWELDPSRPDLLSRLTGRQSVRQPQQRSANADYEEEMRRLRTRWHYILGLLRMQFAPAASLFWNYIRSMPVKPDVLHCNDLDTLLPGVLAKRQFGARLIYDAHEYYPYCDPYGRWLDIGLLGRLERLLIDGVDGAVTVNHMLADVMQRVYRREIYSVPNAEPKAQQTKASKTQMTELAGGRLKCVFQGRYSPKRGTEELILGWQYVDRELAALFLRGPRNVYTEQAMRLADQIGLLNKSIYFLESVTEDELVAAAAEADVGIIPYLPEFLIYNYSCPNKVSQYMHAGLAIVTNDLAYVKSIVENAHAGLIYNSRDLESLGTAINRLAKTPELAVEFKANARKYAAEVFNWQAFFGIFQALYRGEDPHLSTRIATSRSTISS